MKNDGGPAFPIGTEPRTNEFGMSLRDYFAAQAAPHAYLHAPNVAEYDVTAMFGKSRTGIKREEVAAALAYRIADALIARRDSML